MSSHFQSLLKTTDGKAEFVFGTLGAFPIDYDFKQFNFILEFPC